MAPYTARYGHITAADGSVIDECILLYMRAPHSYTGEDTVELQCHGGRVVLRAVLLRTWEAGARPAEAGEFTKRAFLNGRPRGSWSSSRQRAHVPPMLRVRV